MLILCSIVCFGFLVGGHVFTFILNSKFKQHFATKHVLMNNTTKPERIRAATHVLMNNTTKPERIRAVTHVLINNTTKPERIRVHIYNMLIDYIRSDPFKGCDDRCYLTSGTEDYATSSVVLFLAARVGINPPKKYRGQTWIFFGKESPVHYSAVSFHKWSNLFNWTMTYRRDSDIYFGYANCEHLKEPLKQLPEIIINDTDTKFSDPVKAAWMASNCRTPSQREEYVNKLVELNNIRIDIYGGCGKHKCGRSSGTPNRACLNLLSNSYPYYLSFENSLCVDYVTEKVFKMFDNSLFTIPIVRGDGLSYSHLLPFGSYINVNDYSSRKDLVKNMESILNNHSRFRNFFTWRRYHKFTLANNMTFCNLCNKLHQNYLDNSNRVYENIDLWLKGNKHKYVCSTQEDI